MRRTKRTLKVAIYNKYILYFNITQNRSLKIHVYKGLIFMSVLEILLFIFETDIV